MSLDKLQEGFKGTIQKIESADTINKYLLELGFTPGETIEVLRKSPFGGPISLTLRGTTIALRKSEAMHIIC